MPKKLILVLAMITLFFSVSSSAIAQVIINEFMSDPESGPEWVELLNTSSSEVNLTGWSWTELASPGGDTEHESSPKSLSGVIPAGGIFVFEMSSSLNNSGDSIGIYNGTNSEGRVTFGKVSGYTADLSVSVKGKSGALISGSWKNDQSPTKGAGNPASAPSDDSGEESGEDTSEDSGGESGGGGTSANSTSKTPTRKEVKPKVQIISPKLALAGVAFELEGTGTGMYGDPLSRGRYYWNFGDGDSREVKVTAKEKFTHTYFYAGDYTLVFEHYPDTFTEVPDATAEIIIKVIEPKVIISRAGDQNDFFIEISNVTGHNADVSGWVLLSDYKIFTFPRNTVLAPDKKMIISSKVSNFSVEDKNSLKLMTPQRETVFDYALSGTLASQTNTAPKNKISRDKDQKDEPELLNLMKDESVSLGESLPALISQNPVLGGDAESFFSSWITYVSGVIFIGLAAFGVYYIRQKRVPVEAGSDFKILDE